ADLMAKVEGMGGAVAAIGQGFQKSEIERSAYQVAQQIDAGDRVVVGVNRFTIEDAESYEPLRVDPVIEREQADRLSDLRARRDGAEVTRCLDAIRRAAAGTDNVLYPLRDALRARATVGEVCNALRDIWGVYQPGDVG
ncbi:MAG: methylmalonyl-CoA mutase family protein, partial [Actinomycetota bacterium]|nr:methylmalonyl-CoA mutase family protein [Actinomycetota bacterium]